MFIIRQANTDDYPMLMKLAKMVRFVNLPADPELLRNKILRSRKSFSGTAADKTQREFMFVLEDGASGNVIGTSSIRACVSWPEHPYIFLQVEKREHYSTDLQTGAVHVVLTLGTDTSGKSEIGALVLSPAYRGHRARLGAQLSLIRFHFVGLHREWFSDRVMAQMMPPLTPDSRNSLWEYLGRRFINLAYAEADEFSRHSKEFITSLYPKGEIYASLLPPEARALIGRVSEEALPARAMLERLGMKYNNQIDPFDGGPNLEAAVEEIDMVRQTRWATLAEPAHAYTEEGFVSALAADGFRAVRTPFVAAGDTIAIPEYAVAALQTSAGAKVGLTPLSALASAGTHAAGAEDREDTSVTEAERVG